jgi:glycerol uptake facilitator-like aquaporin
MLAVTLPVSGGYLNPAIAIMLWVFKKIDGPRASALVLVQLLGATLAALILRYVLPGQDDILRASRLGAPHLNLDFFNAVALGSILKGAGIELLLTFILTFAVFGLAFDLRMPRSAVMAITIVGLPLTGAALNPARWFGPAIAETTVMFLRGRAFEDNAVYWIGPIAGSLLAGALYSTLVLPPAAEERPAQTAANAAGGPVGASSTLFRARK